MNSEAMSRIAAPHRTTSDKIRALHAAGYVRADIARFLGKRYQHVRNVIEDGPPKGSAFGRPPPELPPPVEAASVSRSENGKALVRIPVGDDGAIDLPPIVQQALGVRPGGVVVAELDDDRLTLFSVRESVRRVQEMVRDLIPGDHSLADELIADRRREAAGEHG